MQQRLREMSDWLKVNGEAIYATLAMRANSCQWTDGERPKQAYGEYKVKYNLMDQIGQKSSDGHAVKEVFFTKKADALYVITVGWPDRELVLRDITAPPDARVTLLGYGRQRLFSEGEREHDCHIEMPGRSRRASRAIRVCVRS